MEIFPHQVNFVDEDASLPSSSSVLSLAAGVYPLAKGSQDAGDTLPPLPADSMADKDAGARDDGCQSARHGAVKPG